MGDDDPEHVTVDGLCTHVPQLDYFDAEDIVGGREQYGAFPTEAKLGLVAPLAAERDAKEREAREAREMVALATRVSRVEKRVDRVYSLTEALQVIDDLQGKPDTPPRK